MTYPQFKDPGWTIPLKDLLHDIHKNRRKGVLKRQKRLLRNTGNMDHPLLTRGPGRPRREPGSSMPTNRNSIGRKGKTIPSVTVQDQAYQAGFQRAMAMITMAMNGKGMAETMRMSTGGIMMEMEVAARTGVSAGEGNRNGSIQMLHHWQVVENASHLLVVHLPLPRSMAARLLRLDDCWYLPFILCWQ